MPVEPAEVINDEVFLPIVDEVLYAPGPGVTRVMHG
jgi:hypothetical protein